MPSVDVLGRTARGLGMMQDDASGGAPGCHTAKLQVCLNYIHLLLLSAGFAPAQKESDFARPLIPFTSCYFRLTGL